MTRPWIPGIPRATTSGPRSSKEFNRICSPPSARAFVPTRSTSETPCTTHRTNRTITPSNGYLISTGKRAARLVNRHAPVLVMTFGAFAFEFGRRSLEESPPRAFRHWTTTRLGQEFRQRTGKFRPDCANLFPLLHASIARGYLLKSHHNFTDSSRGNYFDHVAQEIARCLCNNASAFSL